MRQNKYEYDAFISHAVEDKIPIANELCAKLERAGLKIWYSGKELGVGDSIEKTIERGLNRSRYGIVIFSPTYLAKNWTIREFYTLLAKEIEEQKVILPVLYNITLDELKNKDLVMADRFAVNSDKGIDFVVERLVGEIRKTHVVKKKEAWFSRIWLILMISLLANVTLLLKGTLYSSAEHPTLSSSYSDDRHQLQADQAGYPTLLGEMEGMLTKFSGCGCTHRQFEDSGYESAVQTILPRRNATSSFSHDHGHSKERMTSRQPNRITMAVVFQIEPAGQVAPPGTDEVDGLVQSVTLDEEDGVFRTVTNREHSREQRGQQCLQEVYIGE